MGTTIWRYVDMISGLCTVYLFYICICLYVVTLLIVFVFGFVCIRLCMFALSVVTISNFRNNLGMVAGPPASRIHQGSRIWRRMARNLPDAGSLLMICYVPLSQYLSMFVLYCEILLLCCTGWCCSMCYMSCMCCLVTLLVPLSGLDTMYRIMDKDFA